MRADQEATIDMMNENAQLRRLLENIVINAEVQPDVRMNGATDVYAVPLDDIEQAREALFTKAS
jgi:hypothetical protein